MDATEQTTDVLVIGAGMAGLIAAAELRRAGRRVLVLDKSRGGGGRLASRRIDGATFDHGAQFITTRDPRFADLIEQGWCDGETSLNRCDFNPAVDFQILVCVCGGCEEFLKRGI